ncbi:MAG TPA: glycerol-3-phosphate 1-O-acyltransferase PlsY [Aestuariivirgaceae bacterium]|nr:glycerol-3-phosphate 1-O-acyltransferase PlsY [Aestuariivirgaceae bacterium]
MIHLLAALLGYLCGSIPFGLVLTRVAGMGDIRAIGSGNIGATNVLRTGSKGLAALTLLLDLAKGFVAVLIAGWAWGDDAALIAGVAAFMGHIFPVWLGFRGGKGVATYIGVLFGLNWQLAIAFLAVWLAVAFLGRRSSLSALAAASAVPILSFIMGEARLAAVTLVLGAILFFTHRENVRRLVQGQEPTISFGRKAEPRE